MSDSKLIEAMARGMLGSNDPYETADAIQEFPEKAFSTLASAALAAAEEAGWVFAREEPTQEQLLRGAVALTDSLRDVYPKMPVPEEELARLRDKDFNKIERYLAGMWASTFAGKDMRAAYRAMLAAASPRFPEQAPDNE